MQDKNTPPKSAQNPQRLYMNSLVAELLTTMLNNIGAIQAKYPLDSKKKDKPHKMASKIILQFTEIVGIVDEVMTHYDNHKQPTSLEFVEIGAKFLRLYFLEKKITNLKALCDLNPHPMYITFLQGLVLVIERLPEKFQDLIPFIDPSLIDFTIGQENYENSLSTYKGMILGVLESCGKMQNFTVTFNKAASTTVTDKGELEENGWVHFEAVQEISSMPPAVAALAATAPTIGQSIGQTLWSKTPSTKQSTGSSYENKFNA